jgi:hypothetical protein
MGFKKKILKEKIQRSRGNFKEKTVLESSRK